MKECASPRNLNMLWKAAKRVFASSTTVQELLNMFRTTDMESDVFAVTDKESKVLMAINRDGRAEFPVGTCAGSSEVRGDQMIGGNQRVEGNVMIRDVKLIEGVESGFFYIVDKNDFILFEINHLAQVDFAGIPRDVKSAIDALTERVTKLEESINN